VSYNIQIHDIKGELSKQAEEIIFIKRNNILHPTVEQTDGIVSSLAKSQDIKKYIKSGDEHIREHMEQIFLAVAGTNNQIMQIRFIDKNGMEVVRVDRKNEESEPFVIKKEKLQDKSDRDYFKIVSQMKESKLWHSKIDLNIENGKIEVPYRPTFRVAMPIFEEGHFEGIVILNILTDNLIKAIQTSTAFKHYIIDKEGYFILHPDPYYSWNRYTGTHRNLTEDFPVDASLILDGAKKGEDFFAYSLDGILDNDDDALLVLQPKDEYKKFLIQEKIKSSIIVVALSVVLSILLAIYASATPSKLQRALLLANQELKRFAKIIDRYVITATTKTNTVITDVSTAFSKTSGYSKEELIGEKINIIRHPDTPKELFENIWKRIEDGKEWCGEIKNRKKDGKEYWLDQNIIPIKDENGDIVSYMAVGSDISAKKELERLSATDMLTHIFNRRKIEELLQAEMLRAKRHDRSLSVILLDIDHFKQTNDGYGHHAGDVVLQQCVNVLRETIRKSDMIGRYGGEEFLIVCPETRGEEALIVAEKARAAIDKFVFETVGHKTISLGVAEFNGRDTLEELVKKADIAMYSSKENGRNRSTIYKLS